MEPDIEKLKYPIGKFNRPEIISEEAIAGWIKSIEELPTLLKAAVFALNEEQLNTPYRPDGWTVRQVVHHVADSHMNSFIRFKLALTEENPTIKPYHEEKWAEMEDEKGFPIEPSLAIIENLHKRWVKMLKSMKSEDFNRTFFHPENKRTISLNENTALYAWHGKHHVAHITSLAERQMW